MLSAGAGSAGGMRHGDRSGGIPRGEAGEPLARPAVTAETAGRFRPGCAGQPRGMPLHATSSHRPALPPRIAAGSAVGVVLAVVVGIAAGVGYALPILGLVALVAGFVAIIRTAQRHPAVTRPDIAREFAGEPVPAEPAPARARVRSARDAEPAA